MIPADFTARTEVNLIESMVGIEERCTVSLPLVNTFLCERLKPNYRACERFNGQEALCAIFNLIFFVIIRCAHISMSHFVHLMCRLVCRLNVHSRN